MVADEAAVVVDEAAAVAGEAAPLRHGVQRAERVDAVRQRHAPIVARPCARAGTRRTRGRASPDAVDAGRSAHALVPDPPYAASSRLARRAWSGSAADRQASQAEWAHAGAPESRRCRRRASASMPKWARATASLWSASAGSGSAR